MRSAGDAPLSTNPSTSDMRCACHTSQQHTQAASCHMLLDACQHHQANVGGKQAAAGDVPSYGQRSSLTAPNLWTHLELWESRNVWRSALGCNAQQLCMHKLLALQRGCEQPGDGPPYQQLKGSVWDKQRASHTPTVLDGGAHIIIRQLTASITSQFDMLRYVVNVPLSHLLWLIFMTSSQSDIYLHQRSP